jgi:two-component system response regulator NreC
VIADDHAVLRSGLRLLINAQPDMEVVGEASNGEEVAARVRATRPDVTLLDLTMPRTDAMATIARVTQSRATRVLVLTMHDDPAYVDAALSAGAAGYVVKRAADVELLSAIRAVASGRVSVDVTIRPTLTRAGRRHRAGSARTAALVASLSRRETQVLRFIGQGHTNREIARRLQVGEKSVETYRSRLSQKLQLRGRADLVRYAIQTGLLASEEFVDNERGTRHDIAE